MPKKDQTGENFASQWGAEAQRQVDVGQYPKWPHEVMVKILFGGANYVDWTPAPKPNWKVLDVGCFFLNNLLPFVEIGCECHGIDIHENIISVSREVARSRHIPVQLGIGRNQEIHYPSDTFNLVLSIGTIHYESDWNSVNSALKEFARILAPGGLLFITSTGPLHDLFKRAERLGPHKYKITNYDFRNDQQFFFFEKQRVFEEALQNKFFRVAVGRQSEELVQARFDQFFAVCQKAPLS